MDLSKNIVLFSLVLFVAVGFSQSKMMVEQSAFFGANIGYEIYFRTNEIDSVRFWLGKPMAKVPEPKTILGLKPIAKFKKEMRNVRKWELRKRRFEDALEKLHAIGIKELPDQSSLPYDGVEVHDGWWTRITFADSGRSREIAYHCPNYHKRKEDQIIARAWEILKEADPKLLEEQF